MSYIILSFLSGRSLKLLVADCSMYTKQMKELKRVPAFEFTITIWQSALNLMGLSARTTVLQGKAVLDSEEFLNRKSNPNLVANMQCQQARMFVIFGEHQKGADLSVANGYDVSKASPGSPLLQGALFCGGISSFEMARKTKKRKYKKHANKIHSTIKAWVRKGNPNAMHYDRLMDAEKAALDGKFKAAEKHYQSAVVLAARGGFVNDAALANERYGEFLLHDMSDRQEAVYRFEEAIKFYSEWGADKKVGLLREQYSDLWPQPTEITAEIGPF
jgi:tetratricopeptide (TPR) repeat protein